jgi:Protein of unknown function (DUF4013)
MNIGRSFTYMFDDENWVSKYLVGLVISIVPILNFAWLGYGIGIMRNMARGMEKPLPSWDNLGEKFKDGLLIAVAIFIYILPAIIVIGIGAGATAALGGKGASTIIVVLFSCCGAIYLLAFSFFLPALLIHYARTNSFAALFQFREVYQLSIQNISEYLMAWLTGLIASVIFGILSPVLYALCIIPGLLGTAWVMSVSYYAYGQVGLATIAKSQV